MAGVACLAVPLACSAPGKGALILAISTDMQAPKDIDVVSVYITTNGAPKFDYLGRVLPDGPVSLPSTLAIVEPDQQGAQVRIRVIAFQTQASGSANARVLRDVVTTVPHQRTALLRVPLDFLDDGSGTGQLQAQYVPSPNGAPEGDTAFDPTKIASRCDFTKGLTSINGVCASDTVDSSTLPAYEMSEVYGDGGLQANGAPTSCFEVASCFSGATPVMSLDAQTCSFPLPEGASPSTLNLALVTQSTGACLAPGQCYVPLENDPTEGWALSGSSVEMIPGICAVLMNGVELYRATGPCAPLTPSEPVCEPTGAGAVADAAVSDAAAPDATASDASLTDGGGTNPCPTNWTLCGSTCVDERTDNSYCGSCKTTCTADQVCQAGACVVPPSCSPTDAGTTSCGAVSESCCASEQVAGGTYDRTYDLGAGPDGGATLAADGGPSGEADPATVSAFRLDTYEVTVGRFRQFVSAALLSDGGARWVPPAGSGKHVHLNGGQGLASSGVPGAFEPGWATSDNVNVAPTDQNLGCDPNYATWTTTPTTNESLPINCVTWAEAYAFCIWDGGFLPSEAEWEFAAAGGSQELEYPWGSTDPGMANLYAIYDCYENGEPGMCTGFANIAPVGTATKGEGFWGQFDLAGNIWEWTLDWDANSYVSPCSDCANFTETADDPNRVVRGGGFQSETTSELLPAERFNGAPATRSVNQGIRCARTP
jgi:formylglycine-generating enzyme